MHRAWTMAAALGVVGAVIGSSTPAYAATDRAKWGMDERIPYGTQGRMVDSSGLGNHGTTGSKVRTGVPYGSWRGYEFSGSADYVRDREHLVLVPDGAGTLDPGSRNITMSVEVTTTDSNANILQKGQAGTPGGYYKLEINAGKPACQFRGSLRERTVTGPARIDDGQPHTIACTKTANSVKITVDGRSVTLYRSDGFFSVGTMSNGKPLSIGGKYECSSTVDCDYFAGRLGSARVAFD